MKASDYLNESLRYHERLGPLPIDLTDADIVGFQVSHDKNRIWLCVNGQCILRIKGIKVLELTPPPGQE